MLSAATLLALLAASAPGVTVRGSVVDADGRPVHGALVVAAEGPSALHFMKRIARNSVRSDAAALATTSADETGHFELTLPDETPEFPWRRTLLTIWVHHSSSAVAVRQLTRDWPERAPPLEIHLVPSSPLRLRLLDPDGEREAHASIVPARIYGQRVPHAIAERLTSITDDDGLAEVRDVAPMLP